MKGIKFMSAELSAKFNEGRTIDQVKQELEHEGGRGAEMWAFGESAAAKADIDFSPFEALEKPVNLLILSEEWCPDCTDGLPIIDRIAKETGKVNARVLKRDENLELADQFLNKGLWRSIPTIVVLDEEFNPLGHIAERPDSVTERRTELRKAMHAEHPEFGGFDTRPDELDPEVRSARMAAESALKATTVEWSVPAIAAWIAEATNATAAK
jgi:thiol-disulfide isomerase/thioredoxin